MFGCPNCGAGLRFDIGSQQLYCSYCDSSFDPETYVDDKDAEERNELGVTVYTCTQCGAELISTDNAVTGFCTYCGAEAMMESRMDRMARPTKIIPFQVSKSQCRDIYADRTRNNFYAPKEFRDPEFLERFRGIYIPYWTYNIGFKDKVTLPATKTYTRGQYEYTEKYNVTVDLKGKYQGVPYDASSDFDDTIAENIAPFGKKDVKPFKPGYVAGFYADTADVGADVYRQDAVNRASEQILDKAKDTVSDSLELKLPTSDKTRNALLGTTCLSEESTMFPVWFLTWRKRNRVAYAVVNGETGRISADIPVDIRRYFAGTGIAALILFVIMELFVSVTAPTALFTSSLLAVLAAFLFSREMGHISDRENHIFDRGFFYGERIAAISRSEAEKLRNPRLAGRRGGVGKGLPLLVNALLMFGSYGVVQIILSVLENATSVAASDRAIIGCLASAGIGLCIFLYNLSLLKRVKEKSMIIPAASSFAAVILSLIIAWAEPVRDYYYYIGCILCMAGVAVTCIELIRRYNLLTTRAVPTLYDRKGGDDSGKDYGAKSTKSTKSEKSAVIALILCGSAALASIGAAFAGAGDVRAASYSQAVFTNAATTYSAYIDDSEDLLSDREEQQLVQSMKPITNYGGVAFVSCAPHGQSTSSYARERYRDYFGSDSGMLFMVDMADRNIWIHCNGEIYKVVTKSYANTITDNIYIYATRGDYYGCAAAAYDQAFTLLEGGKVARPMKHVTNALMAIIIALIMNYLLVLGQNRQPRAADVEVFAAVAAGVAAAGAGKVLMSTKKRKIESSSGGGGGFSGGGGGGGFSGGGGGGGHHF